MPAKSRPKQTKEQSNRGSSQKHNSGAFLYIAGAVAVLAVCIALFRWQSSSVELPPSLSRSASEDHQRSEQDDDDEPLAFGFEQFNNPFGLLESVYSRLGSTVFIYRPNSPIVSPKSNTEKAAVHAVVDGTSLESDHDPFIAPSLKEAIKVLKKLKSGNSSGDRRLPAFVIPLPRHVGDNTRIGGFCALQFLFAITSPKGEVGVTDAWVRLQPRSGRRCPFSGGLEATMKSELLREQQIPVSMGKLLLPTLKQVGQAIVGALCRTTWCNGHTQVRYVFSVDVLLTPPTKPGTAPGLVLIGLAKQPKESGPGSEGFEWWEKLVDFPNGVACESWDKYGSRNVEANEAPETDCGGPPVKYAMDPIKHSFLHLLDKFVLRGSKCFEAVAPSQAELVPAATAGGIQDSERGGQFLFTAEMIGSKILLAQVLHSKGLLQPPIHPVTYLIGNDNRSWETSMESLKAKPPVAASVTSANETGSLWFVKEGGHADTGTFVKTDLESALSALQADKEYVLQQEVAQMALTSDGRKFDLRYYVVLMTTDTGMHAFIHKTAYAKVCNLPYSNRDLDKHGHICNTAADHRAQGSARTRWTIQEMLPKLGHHANGTDETMLFGRVAAVISLVLQQWVPILERLRIGKHGEKEGKNKGTITLLAIDVLLAKFPQGGPGLFPFILEINSSPGMSLQNDAEVFTSSSLPALRDLALRLVLPFVRGNPVAPPPGWAAVPKGKR